MVKTIFITFVNLFLFSNCGNKMDPSPLFPITYSKLDGEIEKRAQQKEEP
ncbi:MAG: hypothetical protein K2X39_05805 [Silvanigrellaceae bacterium]|nr:hypothetical protein [Silvanigrellaceae bacterium]